MLLSQLQWGPGDSAGETVCAVNSVVAELRALQWGPGDSAGETVSPYGRSW